MQQVLQPLSKPIDATVSIPGSKSISNRALIIAALAQGVSTLKGLVDCADTQAMAQALQDLGVKIEFSEKCIVQGVAGKFPNTNAKVWCQDSGLALRFLVAACANQAGRFEIDGSKRLRERPVGELVKVLSEQGAKFSDGKLPFMINGRQLPGGEIFIEGNKSSQLLSALLIISPYMQNDTQLSTDNLISKPYIEMTQSVMQSFGVSVESEYKVKGLGCYQAREYQIEPDLSSASYFFAAAALTAGKVTIKNINRKNCLQGDIKFLDVLEQAGCIISADADSVTVQGPDQLCGVEIDMGDISDTFMTLAAISPFASSPTLITNIANTRLKESDRIEAMQKNLTAAGVKVETGDDWMKIYPSTPHACTIDSVNDHRIAMSCSLLGLKTSGIVIDNAECVGKTFPNFFDLWQLLSD